MYKVTNLLCQGHDSAPGLDIMLPQVSPGLDIMLKQQHLSVSGQAADPARQRPPVEYVYRPSPVAVSSPEIS